MTGRHTAAALGLLLCLVLTTLLGTALAGRALASTARAPRPQARPVVLLGISGLSWNDVTPRGTPALWRLAAAGSAGSVVVHAIAGLTCPADGWLTLNGGARAGTAHPASTCPSLPAVRPRTPAPAGTQVPAGIPDMPGLVTYNDRLPFHYHPDWGLLASAAGPGRCALAIGPGAALALAGPAGRVGAYLPGVGAATRQTLSRCPLTVVDLGAVPASATARAPALRAADTEVARIAAAVPRGTTLIVTSLADGAPPPHLRPLIIDGTGYAGGILDTASTRQSGLSFLTDLTPTVLELRGRPAPGHAVGSPLYQAPRDGSFSAMIGSLIARDTAAQVYRTTFGWFFAILSVAEAVAFCLIALLPWGRDAAQRERRRATCRVAGVIAGSIPAGTFLASLVPWWTFSHPALWLYLLSAAWAAVVAAVALAGPWRRDPLGPPGVVGAITLAVVGLDVMTGSRLQLSTPFGLNVLWGGRVYGEDNNTVGIYAASAVFCAAWLAGALSRARHSQRHAVLAASGVTLFAVVASGWPGFGAKVGGTIASVPGFVLLLMAVAGIRMTARRLALVVVSGVVVIAFFGVVSYLLPVTHSDISAFVGQVLHGGGGGTLQRKISTNLSSLTGTPYSVIIPVALLGLGVLLLRPSWFHAGPLTRAKVRVPLLGGSLAAIWLMAVLGWLAEDSGVAVPAAMFPFVLPLAIAIVSSAGDEPASGGYRYGSASLRPAGVESD